MATTRPETGSPDQVREVPLTDLTRGFDYLTLDPGPRLREFRNRQAQSDPFTDAWTIVGKAMREALKMIMQRSSVR
jgi:hypothetical protein